ncbi:unnamed protein product (macronuclear) [Paramecium tetraurelia]|uniref:Uncharacterized protein n=1 Tax=Paramecium tetraurelia TaxID=5888 RepID=A0DW29_PARTE|nr:uncharacterized protein GSPATT00020899001 [Paramecium tetraurelia]CAK87246.1 unnamed protein product [Paramecium tetraurelia]|eukprot:XP_001454643.1 hypothetical protein (macronuclear) [Paramecium tetraurelia strain d4-2]
MQTMNTDSGNYSIIENSLRYLDEEKVYKEIQTLVQQLQGARKKLQEIHNEKQLETQKELQNTQENYYCDQLEDSNLLNSKEIKITYFESKQIEKVLTELKEKIEYLNEKLYKRGPQENLEKQIYILSDQLSKERVKAVKDTKVIQDLKNQLHEKSKQLISRDETIIKHVKEMLKPMDNGEQDEDINFVV